MTYTLDHRFEIAGDPDGQDDVYPLTGIDVTTGYQVTVFRGVLDDETAPPLHVDPALEGRMASLWHPGVSHPFSLVPQGHTVYLVTEEAAGEWLPIFLAGQRPPLAEVKVIALQIIAALRYLRSQEMYAWLSPAFVSVGKGHTIKLTGANLVDVPRVTWDGSQMYPCQDVLTAPENRDAPRVTPAADVYAVGALLYQMASGIALGGETGTNSFAVAAFEHFLREGVPPSSVNGSVPEDWDQVILAAMTADPRSRISTLDELAEKIRSLGEDQRAPADAIEPDAQEPDTSWMPRADAGLLAIEQTSQEAAAEPEPDGAPAPVAVEPLEVATIEAPADPEIGSEAVGVVPEPVAVPVAAAAFDPAEPDVEHDAGIPQESETREQPVQPYDVWEGEDDWEDEPQEQSRPIWMSRPVMIGAGVTAIAAIVGGLFVTGAFSPGSTAQPPTPTAASVSYIAQARRVSGKLNSGTAVVLSWSAVPGSKQYRIQVAKGLKTRVETRTVNRPRITLKVLGAQLYAWRVSAMAHGEWKPYSEWNRFHVAAPHAGSAKLLKPHESQALSVRQAQMCWTRSANAAFYRVAVNRTSHKTTRTCLSLTLKPGGYSWRVTPVARGVRTYAGHPTRWQHFTIRRSRVAVHTTKHHATARPTQAPVVAASNPTPTPIPVAAAPVATAVPTAVVVVPTTPPAPVVQPTAVPQPVVQQPAPQPTAAVKPAATCIAFVNC